jgi:hypothetical protein
MWEYGRILSIDGSHPKPVYNPFVGTVLLCYTSSKHSE